MVLKFPPTTVPIVHTVYSIIYGTYWVLFPSNHPPQSRMMEWRMDHMVPEVSKWVGSGIISGGRGWEPLPPLTYTLPPLPPHIFLSWDPRRERELFCMDMIQFIYVRMIIDQVTCRMLPAVIELGFIWCLQWSSDYIQYEMKDYLILHCD